MNKISNHIPIHLIEHICRFLPIDEYMSFPLYMDYIIYRKDMFIKKTLKHLLQRSICEYFYISQIPFYLLESNECFYESFNNKNMKKKIFHTLSEKYIDCIDKWTYDEFCYKCKSFDCRNSKHYV